ncbi:hypothetical protein [Kitasatospora sp. NPDC090308]|uniref:hypothetical protein n=1 Tax=Kitasatospora sp. NPDC090308 TaxID=3364082 RepID=UPI00380E73FD
MTNVLDAVLRDIHPADWDLTAAAQEDIAGLVMLTPDGSDVDIDIQATGNNGQTWLISCKRAPDTSAEGFDRAADRILTSLSTEPSKPDAATPAFLLFFLLKEATHANWGHATRGIDYDHLWVRPAVSAKFASKCRHDIDIWDASAKLVSKWDSDYVQACSLFSAAFASKHCHDDDAVPAADPFKKLLADLPDGDWHWRGQLSDFAAAGPRRRALWKSVHVLDACHGGEDLDEPLDDSDYLGRVHQPPTAEQARLLSARLNAPDAASRKLPPRR